MEDKWKHSRLAREEVAWEDMKAMARYHREEEIKEYTRNTSQGRQRDKSRDDAMVNQKAHQRNKYIQ